jgi:ferrous iron transport protein B
MSGAELSIALIGNPNCGKTALSNRLTGSRQKVANYAGVTVERKQGQFRTPAGRSVQVLDLPGAYRLNAASLDEAITREVVLGQRGDVPAPDLLVCVVDATNLRLRLHLRFVLEVLALGRPTVIALNLMDSARRRGIRIDTQALARELGAPVVETVAVRRDGAVGLLAQLDAAAPPAASAPLEDADPHAQVRAVLASYVTMPARTARIDDTLDRWLLHPVLGLLTLAAVMFLIFQAVYAWAAPMMELIEVGFSWLGAQTAATLPEGPLTSLLVNGIIAGLGGVLIFLPQILILFAFILALEESGYLPRAAFLLDRMMSAAGLSGRSFIPLLSSFACAIPGIMATRSIADPRDRLATILVAPLMTCSPPATCSPWPTSPRCSPIRARACWGGADERNPAVADRQHRCPGQRHLAAARPAVSQAQNRRRRIPR